MNPESPKSFPSLSSFVAGIVLASLVALVVFGIVALFPASPVKLSPLPSEVYWRGEVWPVATVHHEFGQQHDTLGETDCASHYIVIDVEQLPDQQRDTFLHEVMHVVSGCSTATLDVHQSIYLFAPLLVEFVKTNPQAAQYLSQ